MLSIYKIKPAFQKLLLPVLSVLNNLNITANQITLSSVFLSLTIGVFFWFADIENYFFLALPIGLFIRMALNALDGMMARIYNQQSKKGEVLNEIGDVISDVLIFIPLLKFENQSLYIIVLFIAFSCINEFAGLLGKIVSGTRRYDGPMGKSDRAFIMGVYGLSSFLGFHLNKASPFIFGAITFLLLISTYTRISKSLQ